MTNSLDKSTEPMQLYIDNISRKNKYLAIRTEKGIAPAIYFRKSKWITQEQYKEIINFLLERAR